MKYFVASKTRYIFVLYIKIINYDKSKKIINNQVYRQINVVC